MKRCALAVLITTFVCGSVPAELFIAADSDVTVTSSAILPVDSFFDVFFEIEPPMALPDLAGYQVAIDLNPTSSGVVFGVPTNPTAPHEPIFPSTPPINLGSTADRIQTTAFVELGAEVPIVDGAGIIRVPFVVAAGTVGMFDVTIDVSNTVLADANASPISYVPRHGKINVVPEPSSLALATITFIGLALRRRTASED